jgi:hypothetical protein
MNFKKPNILCIWQYFWTLVWNYCDEPSKNRGRYLGKHAPWVFHQMIGASKMEKNKKS